MLEIIVVCTHLVSISLLWGFVDHWWYSKYIFALILVKEFAHTYDEFSESRSRLDPLLESSFEKCCFVSIFGFEEGFGIAMATVAHFDKCSSSSPSMMSAYAWAIFLTK